MPITLISTIIVLNGLNTITIPNIILIKPIIHILFTPCICILYKLIACCSFSVLLTIIKNLNITGIITITNYDLTNINSPSNVTNTPFTKPVLVLARIGSIRK